MRLALVLLLGLVLSRDEISTAVQRLASDDVAERNAAAHALERLGPAGLERLERERAGATDPEVRGRLAEILRLIRKREEFAQVLGATTRATLRVQGRPAAEVAARLEKALGERIELDGIDPSRRVDLELSGATHWQALDAFGASMGGRFECRSDRIVFHPAGPVALPAIHSGQFRVAAVEVQKLDFRSLDEADSLVEITLELRHQKNVSPIETTLRECFRIDSVTDARGNEVLRDQPGWANCMTFLGDSHRRLSPVFVRGDAVGPLTVRGSAALAFPYERKELTVPLADAPVRIREGDYLLDVAIASIKGVGPSDLRSRLGPGPARLVDDAGKTHDLQSTGGGGSLTSWTWTFSSRAKVEKPKAMVIPWISEIHWVEIPFRFEGIPIP
jgi:hypothetical protein